MGCFLVAITSIKSPHLRCAQAHGHGFSVLSSWAPPISLGLKMFPEFLSDCRRSTIPTRDGLYDSRADVILSLRIAIDAIMKFYGRQIKESLAHKGC